MDGKLTLRNIFGLLVAIIIPLGGGLVTSALVLNVDWEWFEALNHPVWRPPNWLFAPVWSVLYILIGIASFLVWQTGEGLQGRIIPLGVYCFQLILNFFWTPTFFNWKSLVGAQVIIVILWVLIVATIVLFYRVNRAAGYLLIPYITWITIATALNANYVHLN